MNCAASTASIASHPVRAGFNAPFPPGHRASGVVLHVTSLPSPYGIGDVGPAAYAWVDQLAAAGQAWWVGARADRVVGRLRSLDGDVLLFSSGHFMRVFAARWLGLDASCGCLFLLSTTTLSILGYDHDKSEPVIQLWNDVRPGLD
jgi:hypothetical protein